MLNRTLGHYRIVQQLGEGGMGVVYKALDLTLGRPVALKIVHERLTQSAEARARLLREAQLAAALNHPNICTIYEVFEADPQPGDADTPPFGGGPVIALELVDGETLRAALTHVGRFGAKELVDIAVQIADGLAEAHQRRIVHRDLKPHNVLITPAGRIKILDFGLAKAVAESGPTHDATTQMDAITDKWQAGAGVLGTAPYMSPEQAAGKALDSRSDVFSFGTMLYELATGQRPFRGETSVQVVAKILEAEPSPIAAERPDLPAEVDRIIHRCLQKSPDDRYNDTRDLCADLRAAQDALRLVSGRSASVASGTAARTKATKGPVWRRAGAVAVAAAVVAVVGAIFVISRWPGRRDATSSSEALSHRQLTFTGESSFPAISPDGAFLAYVRGEPWGEVFSTLVPTAPQRVVIQDLAGGGRELEIAECRPCSSLSWSPNGASLLVADARTLRVIPRLGGAVRTFDGRGGMATWSPDGSAFAHAASGSKAVRVLDLRTNAARDIPLAWSFVWVGALDWSPIGQRLAVAHAGRERRRIDLDRLSRGDWRADSGVSGRGTLDGDPVVASGGRGVLPAPRRRRQRTVDHSGRCRDGPADGRAAGGDGGHPDGTELLDRARRAGLVHPRAALLESVECVAREFTSADRGSRSPNHDRNLAGSVSGDLTEWRQRRVRAPLRRRLEHLRAPDQWRDTPAGHVHVVSDRRTGLVARW